MINRIGSRCARKSFFGFRSSYSRRLAVETLEDRRQLSVTVSNVHLASDTGSSSTDNYTSNPSIAGSVSSINSCDIQIDHNGDGVIGTATISSGTFSYNPLANDTALQNFEGSINLRYRTIEYDGLGEVIATSGWTNFIFTLDRVGPGVDGLSDISVMENHAPSTVNLPNGFHDSGTSDSQLAFQVVGNTNSSLTNASGIDSNGILTICYATNQWGDSYITVRATDKAGNYSNTTFHVVVGYANQQARIWNFHAVNDSGDMWTFSGTVTDDTSVNGYTIHFGGALTSYNITATVASNGTFSVSEYCPDLSGIISALTTDSQGLDSYVSYYYVA